MLISYILSVRLIFLISIQITVTIGKNSMLNIKQFLDLLFHQQLGILCLTAKIFQWNRSIRDAQSLCVASIYTHRHLRIRIAPWSSGFTKELGILLVRSSRDDCCFDFFSIGKKETFGGMDENSRPNKCRYGITYTVICKAVMGLWAPAVELHNGRRADETYKAIVIFSKDSLEKYPLNICALQK